MDRAPDLRGAIAALKTDPALAAQVVSWHRRAERQAHLMPIPPEVSPALAEMLRARGVERLYSHQARACLQALAGQNTVVVTPTASGKTLCYEIPMLQRLVDGTGNTLLLFPTKALAHDQYTRAAEALRILGLDEDLVATYDGDTPPARRALVRQRARVLISNPDMLHAGILPNHVTWRAFLRGLAYVVLDEMHTYRGVFGSQVAGVLWRLRRLCRFYGSAPRFICTSATVANPAELAEALIGKPASVVEDNGAPEPPLDIALYKPPIVDRRLGTRRAAADDARLLVIAMLQNGLQTVCFTRSRLAVEQMVIALRSAAPALGLDARAIRGYRAGYLPLERREIEAGLRNGQVRCVVATSALELGIDIGGLNACVLLGYPGSTSSTWQRIGRVGRTSEGGLAVLVASGSPLDQYLLTHPEQMLGAPTEAARINPHNLHVRIAQMRSALYELAMPQEEAAHVPSGDAILAGLADSGEVRESDRRWHWSAVRYPAADVSLRTADARRVEIVTLAANGPESVIGQVEASDAPRWLHPGAVYLHEGRQYLVQSLGLAAGVARVEPVSLPFLTVASERTDIEVEEIHTESEEGSLVTSSGELRVTNQVTSFRRELIETHLVLGREPLDMPEQVIYTSGCWIGIRKELVGSLEERGLWYGAYSGNRGPNWEQQRAAARARDGHRCRQCGAPELPGRAHDVHHVVPFQTFGWIERENDLYLLANRLDNLMTLCPACHRLAERQAATYGTLADLGHLLRHLIPLWVLCDPNDIGTHADSGARRLEHPTLFVYDRAPGGNGIAESLPPLIRALLTASRDRVQQCLCEGGCPSCIGPALTVQPERKQRVIALIQELYEPLTG